MDLVVDGDGCAAWGAQVFRAALGRAGITRRKREGDLATPQGKFLLREVLYRPDRIAIPRTRLPFRALELEDGWCDAADDPRYNRRVRLPYPASAEALWRASVPASSGSRAHRFLVMSIPLPSPARWRCAV